MKHLRTVAALLLLGVCFHANAQSNNRINVKGAVEEVGESSIKVRTAAGDLQSFKLSPTAIITKNSPATLADIKPSDFVASAAVRKQDGKLHSVELRIYPELLHGRGEGQHPMKGPEERTMTNATVVGAAIVNGSNDLTVRFGEQQSELIVDPGVPIVRVELVEKATLANGMRLRVQGTRSNDDQTITRISLE